MNKISVYSIVANETTSLHLDDEVARDAWTGKNCVFLSEAELMIFGEKGCRMLMFDTPIEDHKNEPVQLSEEIGFWYGARAKMAVYHLAGFVYMFGGSAYDKDVDQYISVSTSE
jgi:hypothetical protein